MNMNGEYYASYLKRTLPRRQLEGPFQSTYFGFLLMLSIK